MKPWEWTPGVGDIVRLGTGKEVEILEVKGNHEDGFSVLVDGKSIRISPFNILVCGTKPHLRIFHERSVG